ncbi:hypothetical protein [Candidatus Poriferisodalis sp.]|uniref:hypothetical protein n=1 Tax=Candidatus Poriferisodalis sp. TaxID=3101277 RepID=UPI003B516A2B
MSAKTRAAVWALALAACLAFAVPVAAQSGEAAEQSSRRCKDGELPELCYERIWQETALLCEQGDGLCLRAVALRKQAAELSRAVAEAPPGSRPVLYEQVRAIYEQVRAVYEPDEIAEYCGDGWCYVSVPWGYFDATDPNSWRPGVMRFPAAAGWPDCARSWGAYLCVPVAARP